MKPKVEIRNQKSDMKRFDFSFRHFSFQFSP